MNATDSNFVSGTLTNEQGFFNIEHVKNGNYLLKVVGTGYENIFYPLVIESHDLVLPDLKIMKSGISLDEINISAIRKQVDFKNGNVTVQIEGSPLATGNSVFDLLLKLPGVTVDENNAIAIQGKTGVRFAMDDRIQQMSGPQLINFLKSMNASGVEKIEILKNPSVKFDAAGTAGIINIKTKKASVKGISGGINYTYSQGHFDWQSGDASFNYRNDKIVLTSNFIVDVRNTYHDHRFYRKFVTDTFTTIMDQKMMNAGGGDYYGGRLGLDWYVNSKNTIGIKVNADGGRGFERDIGLNSINTNDMGFSRLRFNSYIDNPWNYVNYNLNFEHKIDTLGSSILFSTDYSPNYDLYKGEYQNWFLNMHDSQVVAPFYYVNKNELRNNILSSKLDFVKKLKHDVTLETGVKATVAEMKSNYSMSNLDNSTGLYTIDSMYSNAFIYNEQVLAAYTNISKEWESCSFQAGLRAENTHVEAKNYDNSFHYKRDYFNLFPVINFSYFKNENHNWQINYNRRIDRPNYNSFNPFLNRISVFQSSKGNPNLLPEYSNSIELSHTYKSVLSNSFSYVFIDNFLLDMTLQNDTSKEITAYIDNLSKAQKIAYSLYFNKEIKKWWALTLNGAASYLMCEGNLLGGPYTSNGYFYMASLTNEFLIKSTKVEVNARYIGPRFNGIWKNGPRWGVFLAVKKSFYKDRLNVTMAFDDLFFTMIGSNSIKVQNQDWQITATNDSRRLRISLNYNFGKIKVNEREISSNEEEKNRLGK